MTSSSSLTRRLIELIRARPISDASLDHAALFLLDAIANAVAGRNSTAGQILLRWASASPARSDREAFLLGSLCHIQETDDLHRSSVTHPGCVVAPVVLALGAQRRSNGRLLLHAMLHGYEAMCRIGNAVGREHYRLWHNTATCGPFGAAMAASCLLDLDHDQATHALGNAGTQSSGLWQFLDTGAMSKHLHAGRAAESGVLAAELAALGFSGPPEILEGAKGFFAATCPDARPDSVLASPDAPWQLCATSMKPWPCCRHTHPVIDAGLELHAALAERETESIHAEVYQAALDVCDRPDPQSDYEARFSLHHCLAAALVDGRVGFDSFERSSRERMAPLRARIETVVAEPYESAYPDSYWGARVTVRCADGEVLQAERKACKGDPEARLTKQETVDQARMLMKHGGLSDACASRLIDATLALPSDRVDWDTLSGAAPETASARTGHAGHSRE